MALMEFSMFPLDKGPSLSRYVARLLTIVDQSGLQYRLNPMGTVVEGEWDELMGLLSQCFRELEKDCDRISVNIKIDFRKGVTGALNSKIKSVEEKAGREFKK